MKNKKESYLIEIRFCLKTYYAVWENGDNGKDSLLKKDERILIGSSKSFENVEFASKEITVYDFDLIRKILDNTAYGKNMALSISETIDYKELLNFWNLSQDAANTIGYDFIGGKNKYSALYGEVFYANNIFKPQGEKDYKPQLTKKDCEKLCCVVAQALEMWSEIIGAITKENTKKQLLRKYNYNNKKIYSGGAKEASFFIMRGTIDPYIQQIKDYLSKKYGVVFYLTNEQWAPYIWEKDFFEMSGEIELDSAENAVFPKDFSFFICLGHEQDITFAGCIVEDIQKILATVKHKFNKSILC